VEGSGVVVVVVLLLAGGGGGLGRETVARRQLR